jgi:hypothetical protein
MLISNKEHRQHHFLRDLDTLYRELMNEHNREFLLLLLFHIIQ